MNKPYPCIWFDGKAKEAAEFYCKLFPNSSVLNETAMVVTFELNSAKFIGLNGGPMFVPNEAVSFVIECENQDEIDFLWDNLTAEGGEESMCGWLKDKFGVSWQLVPHNISELMNHPTKSEKVAIELFKMKKIIIEKLINIE